MNEKPTPSATFGVEPIAAFVTDLFETAGMATAMAVRTAAHLVEGDLLGHVTHGLQLCPAYLAGLETGDLTPAGDIEVVSARGSVASWDGKYLSGPWVVDQAIQTASALAGDFGSATIAIRRTHHIGALAAFLEAPARAPGPGRSGGRGLLRRSGDEDGGAAWRHRPGVYPRSHRGGVADRGRSDLIDLSASITANGVAARYRREGRKFPGPWLQDCDGVPSDDPNVLFADPAGSLLPTGGLDHGHKGFAQALILESLCQGLSGEGRADGVTRWGGAVMVRVTDPTAFCGIDEFRRQTQWLVDRCLGVRPRPGGAGVRIPGQRGLATKRAALATGLELNGSIMTGLRVWSEKLGIALPGEIK